MHRPPATVLFDFDGTVVLGHGPVRAYAGAVARRTTAAEASRFLEEFDTALDPMTEDVLDGYDLVRLIAERHGVDATTLGSAYLESRTQLGTAAVPVTAPEGLAEFLERLGGLAHRVLVTNAPATRIPETLALLGLDHGFDEIRAAAGKPVGLEAIIDEMLEAGPVLSVGDVWSNDLAPASARGAATALVAPTGLVPPDAHPTFRAEHLPELYDDLAAWLAEASSAVHPNPTHRKATS
jgi:FMN phosphatase YigB (HAD superfamily)